MSDDKLTKLLVHGGMLRQACELVADMPAHELLAQLDYLAVTLEDSGELEELRGWITNLSAGVDWIRKGHAKDRS